MNTKLSILEDSDFIYVSMRAVIWCSNGLISPTNIVPNTGALLTEILIRESPSKCLILDFKGVNQQVDHSLKDFFDSLSKSTREVVFINHKVLEMAIHNYMNEHFSEKKDLNIPDSNYMQVRKNLITADRKNLQKRLDKLIDKYINTCVTQCYQEFDTGPAQLTSTPVLASGLYNASLIISDPKKFLWVCLALSDKVEAQKEGLSEKVRILSVSLKASPFAITVGQLTDLKVDIIEQIGPFKKLYGKDELSILRDRENTDYIYIGDFTIGGTEIKVAQAYADALHCSLERAVVIGSVFDKEVFKHAFAISFLINLDEVIGGAKFGLSLKSLIDND